MVNKRILKIAQLGLLSAISIILVMFVHFPIFPSAPFLEYDMADMPVLLATILFGPFEGLAVLGITSLVQAFLLGGNGWIGLIMHFCASGALVLISGLIFKKNKKLSNLIIGLLLGSVAMTLLMVPLNLIFTVYFMGSPLEVVEQMLIPIIIPFNLIKSLVNSTLCFIIYVSIGKYLKKFIE